MPEEHKKSLVYFSAVFLIIIVILLVTWLNVFLFVKMGLSKKVQQQKQLAKDHNQQLIERGTAEGGSLLNAEESQQLYEQGTSAGHSALTKDEEEKLLMNGTVFKK